MVRVGGRRQGKGKERGDIAKERVHILHLYVVKATVKKFYDLLHV